MNENQEPLVRLRQISHQYGDSPLFREVNWSLQAGQHWGIIGPSGSGKTTLAKIVAGYLWPNNGGTILRNGKRPLDLSQWRQSVGWISPDVLNRIPGRQSVQKTVWAGCLSQTLFAERRDLSLNDEDKKRSEKILNDLDLTPYAKRPFGELSQGETQLVGVARALANQPCLLVFDEPCAGMDPGSREHFLRYLRKILRDRNQLTTLYITHHLEEIMPEFRFLIALGDGEIQAQGRKEENLTEELFRNLFGYTTEIIHRNGRYWPVSCSSSEVTSAESEPS